MSAPRLGWRTETRHRPCLGIWALFVEMTCGKKTDWCHFAYDLPLWHKRAGTEVTGPQPGSMFPILLTSYYFPTLPCSRLPTPQLRRHRRSRLVTVEWAVLQRVAFLGTLQLIWSFTG